MPEHLIAVDVGTTAAKVGLFTLGGRLLAQASNPYPVRHPGPDMWEQDPAHWWRAVRNGIVAVTMRGRVRPQTVRAVAVSGQTPTLVLVDARGRAVRPAILWRDARAVDEARWLQAEVGPERLRASLGMDLPIEPVYAPAKLLWLFRHELGGLRRTAAILQPKDFINLKLTGETASDPWCSKGMVHVESGATDPGYLEIFGLRPAHIPRMQGASQVVGQVRPGPARELGLAPEAQVVTGWSDALCGILGTGAFASEAAFNLTGTSEIVGLSTETTPAPEPRLLSIPRAVVGGLAVAYGPNNCGGSTLDWFLRLFHDGSRMQAPAREAIIRRVARRPPAPGLLFLPYIYGERAPLWDPQARGAFIGIEASHGWEDFCRAVLVGVAMSARHVLAVAAGATGAAIRSVRVGGGAATSMGWNRIRADVFGVPVQQPVLTESSLLGAAMLGAIGIGAYAGFAEASQAMVRTGFVLEPDRARATTHDEAFGRFKAAYVATRDLVHPAAG
ncbi:MAG: hypothetical protein HYT85_15820 [candidate division NC10 bacterium]|nr:hypothetical protein [candidate division NC10 bacterium]MBI2561646.1 hypothetical protein [candidate division NC10 bacterium]